MTTAVMAAPERALGRLASLQLDEAKTWGEVASQRQVQDARAVLEMTEDAPRLHFFTRPRGGGKTSDLAAVAVTMLLEQLPRGATCYAAAGDSDQARLLLDAMRRIIDLTPGLSGLLQVTANRVSHRLTGATLDVLAADAPGAYGKLADLIIVDELCWWPDTPGAQAFWKALFSGIAKRPGVGRRPRLVVISAPSTPEHWSYGIFQRADRSPRWNLSEMKGPLAWVDPADLEEQAALLLPSEFRQLHLGEWSDAEDRLSTLADIKKCCVLPGDLPPRIRTTYVISVDIGIVNDRTVVVVAHAEREEPHWQEGEEVPAGWRVVVDQLLIWTGSHEHAVDLADVRNTIYELHRAYGRARVVFDPHQFVGASQELESWGVPVEKYTFSQTSNSRLAATLFRLLREHRIALPVGRPELVDELAHVRLVQQSPGVTRMDHARGRHDDQAVAIALAAQALLAGPAPDVAKQVARLQRPYPGTHDWNLSGRAGQAEQALARLDEQYAAVNPRHAAHLIRQDELVRGRPPARWAYSRRR